MPEDPPDGTCYPCNETYSKRGMTTHLNSCREAPADTEGEPFHLVVEGQYRPSYWLHVDVSTGATLHALDRYLRDVWVECCGHLSAFTIDDDRYAVQPQPQFGERDMAVRLDEVLSEGLAFTYEYDFGTTSSLSLRIVDRGSGSPGETVTEQYGTVPVRLLARNDPPDIPCGVCTDPASVVCGIHNEALDGWLCEDCRGNHECEEDMFLPVVNSPRVGMCGYTG